MLSQTIVNPGNLSPSIEVYVGKNREVYYPYDSLVVENLDEFFTCMSIVGGCFLVVAMTLITFKPPEDTSKQEKALDMIDRELQES